MKTATTLMLSVAFWCAVSADAWGGAVYLHDGRKISGRIVSGPEAITVVMETPFGRLAFRASLIQRLERDPAPRGGATTRPDADDAALLDPTANDPPPPPPGTEGANLNEAERKLACKPLAESARARTAAEGLAVWRGFLAQHGAGQLAVLAQQKIKLWQKRADGQMARFGPNWLPKIEVQRRDAQADALVAKAATTADLDKACRLMDEATAIHPFRFDICFTKARRLIEGGRLPEAVAAIGRVIVLEPHHAPALNNMGVLNARQQKWGRALTHLTQAARNADNDRIFDNLDLVASLARRARYPRRLLGGVDRQVRHIVQGLHAQGRHAGLMRWGNGWIAESKYDEYLKKNARIDRQIAANEARIDALERERAAAAEEAEFLRKDILKRFGEYDSGNVFERMVEKRDAARARAKYAESKIGQLEAENDALFTKRTNPSRAGSLVLLDVDGTGSLGRFPVTRD